MNHAGRIRVASVCALSQWALAVAIQIGDYSGYLVPAGRNPKAAATLITLIPFIQTQSALVAVALGAVAYLAAWNRITAWIFFAVYCLESVSLLLDQVYYKVFLDHISLGAFEGGRQLNLALLVGSFTKEVDWIFYCNCAVALAGAVWFTRALGSNPQESRRVKFRISLAFAAALAALGAPAYSSKQFGHVNEHAMLGLVRDLSRPPLVDSLIRHDSPRNLIASWRSAEPTDVNPRLAKAVPAGGARVRRPNVVLIILESVGAVNLLAADGLPSSRFAPNLARLARRGVVFNSVYTTYPGTTRSWICLHTGGQQPTYGWVGFPQDQGPLLARAVGNLGYRTAFFSSERMDGESTNVFLKQAGYQKYYDFSEDPHSRDSAYQIHSWGGREDYTAGLIENWIADSQQAGSPFLLEYMTTATHHPYGAPPGYPAPFPVHQHNSDYLNALHFTDHAIGNIVDFLDKHGLLQDTIVAVTGDHGEAFGELHANDYLHKNFTYDENIREFLLIYDGRTAIDAPVFSPITSSRVAGNRDIMPTLLALIGAPAADVPGRNLLEAAFESRPIFFHKQAAPETWGLRDGRWKFIAEIRTGDAELYDLSADPTEQKNLAAAQPAKVAQYREMCQEWYLQSEREFTMRLKGARVTETGEPATAARTPCGGRLERRFRLHRIQSDRVCVPRRGTGRKARDRSARSCGRLGYLGCGAGSCCPIRVGFSEREAPPQRVEGRAGKSCHVRRFSGFVSLGAGDLASEPA